MWATGAELLGDDDDLDVLRNFDNERISFKTRTRDQEIIVSYTVIKYKSIRIGFKNGHW